MNIEEFECLEGYKKSRVLETALGGLYELLLG